MTNKITSTSRLLFFMVLMQSLHLVGQTKEQAAKITSSYDMKKLESLRQEFRAKEKKDSIAVAAYLKKKRLQKRSTLSDGSIVELQRIDPDGTPVYITTFNYAAARSTRANHLHSGGSLGLNLMGTNMTAHVWDVGIARASHREYDGAGGNNRYSVGDGTTNLNFHAAHVTGTIMASGVVSGAKGMAPHSRVVGYSSTNDLSEATTAATFGMLLSNHSYGYSLAGYADQSIGSYDDTSRNWDALMYNAPYYLMVSGAGNDGESNANALPLNPNFPQYDKLTGYATAKNSLVVANGQDATVDANGNLQWVGISSSSSQGPTDDLRIKPDITGNGTYVYSTYDNHDASYGELSGSSMATPGVTGSLLLLQEHSNNVNGTYMKASTLKGLALHTADDAGPVGPDAIYGWGLLNVKRAAEVISQAGVNSIVTEQTITQGQTISFQVKSLGNTPLKASISWTDAPGVLRSGNSDLACLANDLDIRVTKAGVTSLPWRLTDVNVNGFGDNTKDPYERIDINNASGDYTITISHKGNLTGGSQNFSLVVTGIQNICNPIIPTNVTVSAISSSTARITWTPLANATYQVRYRFVGVSNGTSDWFTVNTAANTIKLTGLGSALATDYEVQVKSVCAFSLGNASSEFSSPVTFTTQGYCASKSISLADEYIQSIQFNTLSFVNGAGNGGYSDYVNTPTLSTHLVRGNSYPISITPTWTGAVYPEGYGAWIDFNNNQVFEASEMVWSQSPTIASPVSGTITIPPTDFIGAVRMRISMKYNGLPSPCEVIPYGEVEDYKVIIENPAAPTNLSVIWVGATAANLSWGAVTNASYQVQYRAVDSLEWNTVGASSTVFTLTNLMPTKGYEARVRTIYPNGCASIYTPLVPFTTLGYCTSQGISTADEFIGRVQFNTINNASGNENGGYSNFTNVSTNLSKGNNYTITVTPTWTKRNYLEGYSAWIDYDKNGIFEANEMVWSQSVTTVSPVSGTVTIPTYVTDGSTRMRVAMKYAGVPTGCEAFNFGEVEDYTVVIGSPSTPTNLTVVSVSTSTADLTWDKVNNATYQIQYRAVGSSEWTSSSLSGAGTTLSGLTFSTLYEAQVRSVFANGLASAYSNSVTFTTPGYCVSKGNNATDEYIGRVQINTINNVSGNENGGYSDFTAMSTNLETLNSYTITVTPTWKGTVYAEGYSAWIDFNRNYAFEANELVWSQPATTAATVSGTITIPFNVIAGPTRMRVSMKYNFPPTACEVFNYGEVEDYTVNLIDTFEMITTSIEPYAAKSERFYVYPNPTDNELFLSSIENVSQLTIYNVLGQEVMHCNATEKIDVSHLSKGLYVLNASFDDGTLQTVKFNKK